MNLLYSDQYFTDYGAPRASEKGQSFLDRIKSHLAWRLDRGIVRGPEFYGELLGSSTAKVCDLGCGNGALIKRLADHGFQVVGIEPSPFARAKAESRGLKVYEGTAEALPSEIPLAAFDLVVMNHVLEHCLNPALAVRNALGLIRNAGYLVVVVPNCSCFQFATRGPAWYHFDVGRHVNYFTSQALATLVERHEAVVTNYFYYSYLDHFLPPRLECETAIWDRQTKEQCPENLVDIPRPSKLRNWSSLFQSSRLRQERKYECLGIVARRS